MSLVTLEQFATYLKQDTGQWDSNERASLCIEGASGAAVEYCGWHIAPRLTTSVTVDGSGTRIQPLPTLNLVALNTLAENGQPLDVNRIDWSGNGLLEKYGWEVWTRRRRGVVADIEHGYVDTPSWIVTLVCAVAARGFLTSPGVMQESAGGESITYSTSKATAPPGVVTLMDYEKKMLDRVRVPLAA
jgi:hypothetical protein